MFFDSQEQHYPHDVFVPHGIDPSAVYMLRVEGSSVNRKVASGGYVLCLPIESAPRNFKSGDWVVAERRRGDLLEWTVKQVKRSDEGHWELLPCSDDPRYQSALVLGDKDNETVSVKAFVLDFISPGTHF